MCVCVWGGGGGWDLPSPLMDIFAIKMKCSQFAPLKIQVCSELKSMHVYACVCYK